MSAALDPQALIARLVAAPRVDWYLAERAGALLCSASSATRNRLYEVALPGGAAREVLAVDDGDVFFPSATVAGTVGLADRLGRMDFQLTAPVDDALAALPRKRALFAVREGAALLVVYGGPPIAEILRLRFPTLHPDRPQRVAVLVPRDGVWGVETDVSLGGALYAGHVEWRDHLLVGTTAELIDGGLGGAVAGGLAGGVLWPAVCADHLWFARVEGDHRVLYEARLGEDEGAIRADSVRVLEEPTGDLTQLRAGERDLFFLRTRGHAHVLVRGAPGSPRRAELTTGGFLHDYLVLDERRVAASFSGPRVGLQSLVVIDVEAGTIDDLLAKGVGLSLGRCTLERGPLGEHWSFRDDATPRRGVVVHVHPSLPTEALARWMPQLQLFIELGYEVLVPDYIDRTLGADGLVQQVRSIAGWLAWAKKEHPGVPIYAHGVSQGATVLELLLPELGADALSGVMLENPLAFSIPSAPPAVPVRYFLGENDHTGRWEDRLRQIEEVRQLARVRFRTYPREGHVFRESATLADVLAGMSDFLARPTGEET